MKAPVGIECIDAGHDISLHDSGFNSSDEYGVDTSLRLSAGSDAGWRHFAAVGSAAVLFLRFQHDAFAKRNRWPVPPGI